MTKWKFFSLAACMLLVACNMGSDNSDPLYQAATGDGALRAHVDSVNTKVEKHRRKRDMRLITLDSVNQDLIDTEYAYWEQLRFYSNKSGLRMIALEGKNNRGNRLEEFHFDKEGKLIYSYLREESDSSRYEFYYVLNELVFALKNDERQNPKTDSIKLRSILMVKEAVELRKLIAQKTLVP